MQFNINGGDIRKQFIDRKFILEKKGRVPVNKLSFQTYWCTTLKKKEC